ncbi:MAG: catechol 2,3-dioxygenase-like lactoylglutathione lyase family enzyme, partial [Alphaproteobacteria bacterium]
MTMTKPAKKIRPILTHAGIWVWDMEKMESFYTRMLGFEVSDRGFVERYN